MNAIAALLALIGRIAGVLAARYEGVEVGVEWNFLFGGHDITAWKAAAGTLVLQVRPLADWDAALPAVARTVTVCPGLDRPIDVIAGDGLAIGECRGAAAAFAIALDYLAMPQLAVLQGEPDPCGV